MAGDTVALQARDQLTPTPTPGARTATPRFTSRPSKGVASLGVLLANGARIERDRNTPTAVHKAAWANRPEVWRICSTGADQIQDTDGDNSTLHWATSVGSLNYF